MEIGTSTAFDYVQEGLKQIVCEPTEAVRTLMLERYDDILQRLMPLLDDGAPGDVVDGILKVTDKILALHSGAFSPPGGEGDGGGDSEASIILRIKAEAPVLRPDSGCIPANPIL